MLLFVAPIALPLGGVLGYQAMPDSGEVYAVPLDQAYSKLQMMELEPGLRSMVAASDNLGLTTSGTPNQSVVWTFTHEGSKVGEGMREVPVEARPTRCLFPTEATPLCSGGS